MLAEGRRGISESFIIWNQDSGEVKTPHLIRDVAIPHLRQHATKHPWRADVDRQANDAANGTPQLKALSALHGCLLILFLVFCENCRRRTVFLLDFKGYFTRLVKGTRQAFPGAVFVYRR